MYVEIRPATPADLDEVLSVLDSAAAWLQVIGVTRQWPASFSANASERDLVESQVHEGQFYVAFVDAAAAGVFRLVSVDANWPQAADEEALYLHTFAVRRAMAGTGVSDQMLAWARNKAAAESKAELRLDCWAGNARLRRYYTSAGFEFRGEQATALSDGRSYEVARFAIGA